MAGDVFLKERAAVTLQNGDGASLTDGTAGAASTANLDVRSSGNVAEDLEAAFELQVVFASAPSVGKEVELYLVPSFDGTNFEDVDTSSGASVLPAGAFRGSFILPKSQTTCRLMIDGVTLSPLLYKVYLLNKTGITINSNWTLKAITDRFQYS